MFEKYALGVLLGCCCAVVSAQSITDILAKATVSAYAQDQRGVVARSPYGLCWRTGYWTMPDSVIGCDGELASPIPKMTAPAPAPAQLAPPAVIAHAAAPTLVAPGRCDFSVTLESDQAFGPGRTTLSIAAKKRLDDEVLGKLALCGKIDSIRIFGHADRTGSRQTNQLLSEMRAAAVANYLKSKNITAPIETSGMGEKQAITNCAAPMKRKQLIRCLAPDRRVELKIKGLAR